MTPAHILFGVSLNQRKNVGFYPSIQEVEVVVGGTGYALGYRFRDYGKLLLSIIKRVESVGGELKAISQDVTNFYKLPEFVGSTLRVGGKFTNWMIEKECPVVGVIIKRKEKKTERTYLGTTGACFLKSASSSPNIVKSFEDLVLLKVLAEKLKNLTFVLDAVQTQSEIVCSCTRAKGEPIRHLKGKQFSISSNEVFTSLKSAFLIHCESPVTAIHTVSSNSPVAISGLIYNGVYHFYHELRDVIQTWINTSSEKSNIRLEDPHEISDRMAREITRGFEKIGLLHFSHMQTRYASIPDQLLADLVAYLKQIVIGEAALRNENKPEQLPLASFVRMVKTDFRILINPDDIIQYLGKFCDCRALGIDLRLARGYLIADYHQFTERLEALGLATIRPDGEVMISLE